MISIKRMTKLELELGRRMYPEVHVDRPRTRGDCRGGIRPCPFVACANNLYLDVNPDTGAIKLNFPDLEPHEMKQSCSLDIAEGGGTTLERLGDLMNITRERVRQLEGIIYEKILRDPEATALLLELVSDREVSEGYELGIPFPEPAEGN